ncbi:Tup N-terminal-domain-containing protein [Crassisporium funariophilum]|nr:Tup N-terminal-domain-containing protein [Crassisporium funariophilum]
MSHHHPQHRTLQPTGPPAQGQGQGQGANPQARLNESLDVVRQEFDLLTGELNLMRSQRDEYEQKIVSQVNELNIIRQSLYDLESQHGKIRQHYEEEIARARLAEGRSNVPTGSEIEIGSGRGRGKGRGRGLRIRGIRSG